MKRVVLLNPGPVNVTDRVRQAQSRGDLCHREKEFSELMGSIRSKLLRAFHIEKDFTPVLISGSGTAALEMAVSSCLSPGKTLLVIQNGVYGERIAEMAAAYDFQCQALKYDWGQPPNLKDIESALEKNSAIEVVAMVHHETTTGLLNPLPEVAERVHRYRRRLLVDCISSLAGDEIDFGACPIDFAVGTANKCIQGLPGVSFVLTRKKELDRLETIPPRSLYFNLFKHQKAQEAGDTLFTPAVPAHYALDAALDELLEETVAGRVERYRAAADFLRKGFEEMGLEMLVPEPLRSNGLTALRLPDGIDYQELHRRLKEQGFVIYAGQGNLADKIFRIANMGDLHKEELEQFLGVLRGCLTAARPNSG